MVVIMKFLFLFYLLFVSLRIIESAPPFACDPGNGATRGFKFCSLSLSIKDRVQDLIPRLTLQEKIRLIVNNAIPIERLGLRGYEWWSEALHGVSNTGPGVRFGGNFPGATSFPQVITTAASYNDSLWTAIGKVVSTEARAMHNGGVAGLTYWSPNVNIFRDPRWGRGQETPGEDPILAGRYAASYVRGLQGGAGNYLKVAACCKHYTAYDLDSWKGHDRYHFNAQVSKQDIEEIFNVPFKACVVEGKVASVMCSYNQVNGKPTCADPSLLRDTIRGEWRLDGYIVSDCDSVGVMFNDQHFTPTPEDAAADVIRAGLDLDCGPFLAIHTEGAVKMGKLSEGEIDQALANLLTVQMRLGMFDGPRAPFSNLGPQDVCTQAHQQLAREAAQQGIVLLKNQNRALPLSTKWTIAVVGPHAEATVAMIGNYAGIPCRYTTPLDGISKYARTIQSNGCTTVSCTTPRAIPRACDAAREADATVVFVGLSQEFEREALDRTGLFFPGYQQELVSLVARDSKGPVVLVILSGGPIDITFAKNDPKVSAILWAGYPGEAGGLAIADVLFGAANPGGKLPMTWYPGDYVNKVQMTDMAMRADNSRGFPGRTYRFYKGPVVYPFGFGLSYTNFRESVALAPRKVVVPVTPHNFTSFEAIAISNAHCDSVKVPLDIEVENVGDKDGSHTVMVFSKTRDKRLIAFKKVHIFSGGKHRVRLDIDACEHLSEVDEFGVRRIPMGKHILQVGQHVTHSFKVLHKTIINH